MHKIEDCRKAVRLDNEINGKREIINQLLKRGNTIRIQSPGSRWDYTYCDIDVYVPTSALIQVLEEEIHSLRTELNKALSK